MENFRDSILQIIIKWSWLDYYYLENFNHGWKSKSELRSYARKVKAKKELKRELWQTQPCCECSLNFTDCVCCEKFEPKLKFTFIYKCKKIFSSPMALKFLLSHQLFLGSEIYYRICYENVMIRIIHIWVIIIITTFLVGLCNISLRWFLWLCCIFISWTEKNIKVKLFIVK